MYLGIDFGTSFSKVSTLYFDQPLLLQNPGEYGLPSAFYYDRNSGILIGQDALDAGQGSATCNLVTEVKMAILSGRTFTLDGRTFTAEEIVREIYKALLTRAVYIAKKRRLDTNIEGAVISVPAKFGIQERHLILQAAKDCLGTGSIPVKAILREPVAAALAYYDTSPGNDSHVLVYDLGGGTCDVALVRADSRIREHYTVVDSDMVRLGGRNWDEALGKHITSIIEQQSGIRIHGNVGYEEKIRRAAISVKHDLSDPMKTGAAIARVELNGTVYTTPVTRQSFDEITSHLLRETLDCLEDVYDRNASKCRIDEIICVGGSSNMPQVEEGLLKRFSNCRIRIFEPEHAVVNGSTFFANQPMQLVDTAVFSYGTDTFADYDKDPNYEIVVNLIRKGSSLPAQGSHSFNPVQDGQSRVQFSIYESEFGQAEYDFTEPDKRFVGQILLQLPPNATRSHSLTCQAKLNVDGQLEVEAWEPSGNRIEAVFEIDNL